MRAGQIGGWARGALVGQALMGVFSVSCGEVGAPTRLLEGGDDDLCPGYCALAMAYCRAPVRLFDSQADCEAGCAALPQGGHLGTGSGDTVACRLTYLLAEPTPGVVMCTYARPEGSPVCR